ncbi:MAG: MFS transporter [Jannaschia sp.]
MKAGFAALTMAYVLSQFYRAFLAVLAPDLTSDLGIGPADLSRASGFWFLTFAVTQLPVGWALDRFGPRRTAAVLHGVAGGGGAAVFALASTQGQIEIAMGLIGIGCAPVLMCSYYIFARTLRPAVFATFASMLVGVGSLGNVAASVPLGLAAEALGWRGTMAGLAAVTIAVAIACWLFVRDPDEVEGGARGSLLDILRIPAIWAMLPILMVNYAPAAALRGLWAGPYITEFHGPAVVGMVTLVMGLAMIAGSFLYAPADRIFGTRKWVIMTGNLAGAGVCAWLWWTPVSGLATVTALFAAVGCLGSTYALCIAHGRAFFPPHLVGRGVTLLNFFSIGGVGLIQFATGPVFASAGGGVAGYQALFGVFALALLVGCASYAFAPDKID